MLRGTVKLKRCGYVRPHGVTDLNILRQRIKAAAQLPVLRHMAWFFDSYYFPAVYAVLVFLCSVLGWEIAFFALTALAVVFICVFSRDSRPMLAFVFLTTYCISWKHTPQPPFSSDFFYDSGVQTYLLCLGILLIVCMLFRFIVFPQDRNFFKESKLRLGIALMVAALLLNGVFFGGYTIADLPFGLLIALSLFVFYIFFFHTMRTDENTVRYVAYIMVLASGVIFLQLAKIYIFDDIIVEGSVNKDILVSGWGMSNNVGGMLGMLFPACFYMAVKSRRGGWAFYVLAFVFFGGVCLTLSRTSALVSGIVLVASAIYLSISKSNIRKFVRIFNCVVLVGGIVFLIVMWDFIRELLAVYFDRGFSDSGRFFIWESGIKNFLRAPVFGVGFYEPIAPDWSYNIENWIFPDMYHNLFIQMLASCGIFGIIALCVHLVQVLFAIKKSPNTQSLFCLIIFAGIFGMSLLDNHIFHIFPAFIYSVFLLLSEREGESGPLVLLRPLLIGRKKAVQQGSGEVAATAGNTGIDNISGANGADDRV